PLDALGRDTVTSSTSSLNPPSLRPARSERRCAGLPSPPIGFAAALRDLDLFALLVRSASRAQNRAAIALPPQPHDLKDVMFGIAAIGQVDLVADGNPFRQDHPAVGRARAVDEPIPAHRKLAGPL